jgi:hypothetical protein
MKIPARTPKFVTLPRNALLSCWASLRKSFRGFRKSPDWATKSAQETRNRFFTRMKSYGRFAR